MLINAWRNINYIPIEDHNLAFCDPQTVTSPDDFISHYDEKNSESFRLNSFNA